MAIDIMRGVALMTPKLHTKRCIIADISTGLHVSKSTRKKARSLGLSMTADGGWDACIDMITRNHKRCWLYPQLHTAYKHMWKHRDKYTTQLHSFEVWDKEGRLVACELGFIVGTIYTSLTGTLVM